MNFKHWGKGVLLSLHCVVILMMFSCGAKEVPEVRLDPLEDFSQEFWNWFVETKDNLEGDNRTTIDAINVLSEKLQVFDENIVAELGTAQGEIRELVISADGIGESFDNVKGIVAYSPRVPGWKVIAFRQRVNTSQFTLEMGGRSVKADEFYFKLHKNGDRVGMDMYVPDLTEENKGSLQGIAYILLDMSIGEYDVTTGIDYIEWYPVPSNPKSQGLMNLTQLSVEFDNININ